jgi:hypothetical protein
MYLVGSAPFEFLEMVERGEIIEAPCEGPITADNLVDRAFSMYLDKIRAHCANVVAAAEGRGPVVIDINSRRVSARQEKP